MFVFTVDLGLSVQKDNVTASSPETMEMRAVADANGKNLGNEAKPEAPAAKSRFFLTLSRPVPGRTGDQGTDSSSGPAKLDVSSNNAPANKDPSEQRALPGAAAPGRAADKTPGRTPAPDQALSAPGAPESGAAPAKDTSFLDKLFKLDKGRDKAAVDSQEEARRAKSGDQAEEAPGCPGQGDAVPAGKVRAHGGPRGRTAGTDGPRPCTCACPPAVTPGPGQGSSRAPP